MSSLLLDINSAKQKNVDIINAIKSNLEEIKNFGQQFEVDISASLETEIKRITDEVKKRGEQGII